MRKFLIAAAALAVAWPTLQAPSRAESVIDRAVGGDDRNDNRDRQDIQRNQNQIDRAHEEGRRGGREDSRDGVRRDQREMNGEDGRVDQDRRGLSGSSRDPREGRHDDN
ncbi:MAG: hypothetical protein JWL84_2006 [Rhodospirillales bacterium]|jgi:hypothetical protein|nr:hypothetical protein [Rhodospirillales bacterium]